MLLTACRTSKEELLNRKIYSMERDHHYTIYYGGQKISFFNTYINKENVARICVNRTRRKVTIVPIKKDIEYLYFCSILDSLHSMIGNRQYLMIIAGVPYTSQLTRDIDSFRIEKSRYKGFTLVERGETLKPEERNRDIVFVLR